MFPIRRRILEQYHCRAVGRYLASERDLDLGESGLFNGKPQATVRNDGPCNRSRLRLAVKRIILTKFPFQPTCCMLDLAVANAIFPFGPRGD